MADVPRDDKGKVGDGNDLRRKSVQNKAKKVSRFLKREFIRRYKDKVISPSGETLGKEGAEMAHWCFLMDIMEDAEAENRDRIAAIKELGIRKDGKAVDVIQLTGLDGGPLKTETTVTHADALSPAQKLAQALKSLGLLAQHGGLDAGGQVGGVGGDAASGDEGATGAGGDGEPTP